MLFVNTVCDHRSVSGLLVEQRTQQFGWLNNEWGWCAPRSKCSAPPGRAEVDVSKGASRMAGVNMHMYMHMCMRMCMSCSAYSTVSLVVLWRPGGCLAYG